MMRINNYKAQLHTAGEMLMLGTNLSRIPSTLTALLYSANAIVRSCWLPASRKPPKKGKNYLIKTIILPWSCLIILHNKFFKTAIAEETEKMEILMTDLFHPSSIVRVHGQVASATDKRKNRCPLNSVYSLSNDVNINIFIYCIVDNRVAREGQMFTARLSNVNAIKRKFAENM